MPPQKTNNFAQRARVAWKREQKIDRQGRDTEMEASTRTFETDTFCLCILDSNSSISAHEGKASTGGLPGGPHPPFLTTTSLLFLLFLRACFAARPFCAPRPLVGPPHARARARTSLFVFESPSSDWRPPKAGEREGGTAQRPHPSSPPCRNQKANALPPVPFGSFLLMLFLMRSDMLCFCCRRDVGGASLFSTSTHNQQRGRAARACDLGTRPPAHPDNFDERRFFSLSRRRGWEEAPLFREPIPFCLTNRPNGAAVSVVCVLYSDLPSRSRAAPSSPPYLLISRASAKESGGGENNKMTGTRSARELPW